MLICKLNLEVKELAAENMRSFEHASWMVGLSNKSLTITGIYRPPPKSSITNAMFVGDFTKYLSDLLTTKLNNIILGDFMHVGDPFNSEATIFKALSHFAFALAMICFDVYRHLPSLSVNSTTENNRSEMASQTQKQTQTLGVNEPVMIQWLHLA